MKKTFTVFTPIFISFVIILCAVTPSIAMSENISTKVFRLHILANSDSEPDQMLKLKVRDKILDLSTELYSDCSSVADAVTISKDNIHLIKETAQKVISFYGYTYDTTVLIDREFFNTRHYDGFTLPAGTYDCLKIVIGKGNGHNWWCVMFPQVCLSGCTEDFDAYLTEDEKRLITNNGYQVKFKAVEIFERIKDVIS